MPKGFAAAAGLTPPSIVGNGAALWAQAPALDVRAAACSNAAATREMMDAGLRQLSSFSRLTLTARSAMAKKAAAPKASKAKKAAPAKKK